MERTQKNTLKGTTYLTASSKGGVGKTLNMALVIHAHDMAGIPVNILEYDPVQPLRQMYPNRPVSSHAVTIRFEDQLKDPTAALEYLAPLIEALRDPHGALTIDTGSPMIGPLFDAIDLAEFADEVADQGAHLRPIIPTTTDRSDLEAAHFVYTGMRRRFPKAQIAFVISEHQQSVASIENMTLLQKLRADAMTKLVILPSCSSCFLAPLYGHARLSFTEMLGLTKEELARIPNSGSSPTFIAVHRKALREWVNSSLAAYGTFLPQAARKAA